MHRLIRFNLFTAAALVTLTIAAAGCSPLANSRTHATAPASTAAEDEQIRPIVVKMAENVRQLKAVYKQLHADATDMLAATQNDEQLGHIQKAYLFVDAARTVSHYQWQLFSVVHYIKPERRKDYFTLRARGLADARSEMAHVATLLEIYQAYVTFPAASQHIEQGIGIIRGNLYLYDQLLDVLKPLVNPAGAFTPDPYAPIGYPQSN